ncbi:FKBP-type peptidyl-prolyl cis-trans isomerase [Leptothrix sp. BB-4]
MSTRQRFPALNLLVRGMRAALLVGAAVIAPLADAADATEAAVAPLATLKDKTSYATGVMTARNLLKNEVPFDVELLVQGLRDAIAGGPIRMDEKELKVVLQSMQADMQRHLSNDLRVKASLNQEKGKIFRTDYAKKAGVVQLPGELMYRVVEAGKGDKPTELSKVVVKYRGTLIDGTEFDATPEGKTVTLKLTDVITGWREALKRMPAGSTWEVVVPPTMAYSNRGAGPIGPNETLVFSITLVALVE